jgi:hypothetical protein
MIGLLLVVLAFSARPERPNAADGVDRLVAAVLGHTPMMADLEELTDEIGGRVTGSEANRRAVAWAADKFREAGVKFLTEKFEMPSQWQEKSVRVGITGDVSFEASAVAKPFSIGADGLEALLLDGGTGSEEDFDRLGDTAQDAWVLVETDILDDEIGLHGLFTEYTVAAEVERRAFAAGAVGVVFMSSRPKNLLYRLFASQGVANSHPLLVMEREDSKRALRLIRAGHDLSLKASIDVDRGYAYTAANVIGEIPGSERPEEIVLFGAHLDSHDLGTGALDNGVNVCMLIDIARQITALGLQPKRTIRFALWNGEEQGMVGSWKYTEQHESELGDHIVAASFDIGSGRTSGFFTGGRPDLVPLVDASLEPVSGLGPFQQIDAALVGTDNFDFMIEGVPNLVAIQADANYASNYHAESDTFDKVDQQQARLNAAVAAAVIWGFANGDERLPRQSSAEIETVVQTFGLEESMRNFGIWPDWESGARGRHE